MLELQPPTRPDPVPRALAPTTFTLAPISRALIAHQLAAGSLSHQLGSLGELHAALPPDPALARLTTGAACAALRAPILDDAIANLHRLTNQRSSAQGPRLEDLTGDTAALRAARRMVADLRAWQAGTVRWNEISHSLLLHGAPGTGKTQLAQAMGNSAGLSVVKATFGEWQAAGHLGDMLRAMRSTFAEARRQAPSLLIIDEIDAVGARADADRHARHYRIQVVSAFLTELDAIAHDAGVIVIGTANHPDRMDPAVLRAGRMDLKVEVPLPDADQLLAALRQKLQNEIDDDAMQQLARLAVGVSFADLDAAIRAARSDARHGNAPLTAAMIATHLGISLQGEDRAYLWRIAVHEAGHAIMAAALQLGPIERVMIAAGGGQIARRERPSQTRLADIEAEITYALAGRAAELLLLGEASAGAGGPGSSDLAIATRHAIRIEVVYGLGYEGPVWHADPDAVHLATPAIRDRVRQRLQQAERRASEILQQHRQTLDGLARALLEQRSMSKTAIAAWLTPISKTSGDAHCDHDEGHPKEQLLMEE